MWASEKLKYRDDARSTDTVVSVGPEQTGRPSRDYDPRVERGRRRHSGVRGVRARSIALAGFGLDSVIEIEASTVVLWELAEVARSRQKRAMRLIGLAFVFLAVYLAAQSTIALVVEFRPHHSAVGIAWTAVTAVVMFALATGKSRTGARLGNPVSSPKGA